MFKNLIGQKVSGFKERMGEPGRESLSKGDSIRGDRSSTRVFLNSTSIRGVALNGSRFSIPVLFGFISVSGHALRGISYLPWYAGDLTFPGVFQPVDADQVHSFEKCPILSEAWNV